MVLDPREEYELKVVLSGVLLGARPFWHFCTGNKSAHVSSI